MGTLLDTLRHRASHAVNTLDEPAPDRGQIDTMIACALSAPDHGKLRPWRFVVIEGAARLRLGAALCEAAAAADPDFGEEQAATLAKKALRAPLIVACVTEITTGLAKVPEFEQVLSTGAAMQQLQLAAGDMGFGSVWLSGPHCNAEAVKSLLGAADKDLVAGFIYLGTPSQSAPAKPRPAVADHLSVLPAAD